MTFETDSKKAKTAIGVDRSLDMLKHAGAVVWRSGLRNCQVRQADMLQLPYPSGRFDTVTLRMVLHFADQPGAAIAEAARVLMPGGRLILIDFTPHERTELREEHAHRWMGFADSKIGEYFQNAGLVAETPARLEGEPLTVCLWAGRRAANDAREPSRTRKAG